MRIKTIELYNIGSYEGRNLFDIEAQSKSGKVVLIGGKNGAGKTTLFTAIKLCLYGHRESGYQNINAFYKKKIVKLVNDKAKIENVGKAFVIMELCINNGQDWDTYCLKRVWNLQQDDFERFTVWKNDIELTAEELSDFENYLLNLIPPELFELYFFDGEQIADYFLEDAGNERVKHAFLTLCGYDTFEILYKNFKRISKNTSSNNEIFNTYLEIEDKLYQAEKEYSSNKAELERILVDIECKNSELKALEERYTLGGGVTVSEWNDKFLELKNEERLREEKNAWLRTAANDIIPYIIVQSELKQLLDLMEKEKEYQQLESAKEVLKAMLPGILLELNQNADLSDKICTKVDEKISATTDMETILSLSKEEYNKLSSLITILLGYKKEEIINVRNEIRDSIKRSKKLRTVIENSNVDGIDSFLQQKESMIEERENLIKLRDSANEKNEELLQYKAVCELEYKTISKELDKQLKSQSVNDLSMRTTLFLEELQKRLFESEILKVQNLFMQKMNQLMRKDQFIDCIRIDSNFNIHVYKRVSVDANGVSKKIQNLSTKGYEKEYGIIHCEDLLAVSKCSSLDAFVKKYEKSKKSFEVLLEFDKSTMSKGEKQVFIMSLYWAMMQMCNKEIPFIIDTPFARIDTEHRAHITEFFFKELCGQVFIFSTNEEITPEHVEVIGSDLQAKFLIENIDNKKTIIEVNKYFGEQ